MDFLHLLTGDDRHFLLVLLIHMLFDQGTTLWLLYNLIIYYDLINNEMGIVHVFHCMSLLPILFINLPLLVNAERIIRRFNALNCGILCTQHVFGYTTCWAKSIYLFLCLPYLWFDVMFRLLRLLIVIILSFLFEIMHFHFSFLNVKPDFIPPIHHQPFDFEIAGCQLPNTAFHTRYYATLLHPMLFLTGWVRTFG